jgi:hypothetical protein
MDLNWEAKPNSLFIVSLLLLSLFPFLILPGNNEAIASQHRLSIVSETGESRVADFTSGTPSQSVDAQWKGHLCLSGKTPGIDHQMGSEKKTPTMPNYDMVGELCDCRRGKSAAAEGVI